MISAGSRDEPAVMRTFRIPATKGRSDNVKVGVRMEPLYVLRNIYNPNKLPEHIFFFRGKL